MRQNVNKSSTNNGRISHQAAIFCSLTFSHPFLPFANQCRLSLMRQKRSNFTEKYSSRNTTKTRCPFPNANLQVLKCSASSVHPPARQQQRAVEKGVLRQNRNNVQLVDKSHRTEQQPRRRRWNRSRQVTAQFPAAISSNTAHRRLPTSGS